MCHIPYIHVSKPSYVVHTAVTSHVIYLCVYNLYPLTKFVTTYKYRKAASTQSHLSRPELRGTRRLEIEATRLGTLMKCARTAQPSFCSIDLSLVAWAVLDTLHFKLLFDVFGATPLHGDCIHATHIFIYHRVLASGGAQKN